MKSIGLPSKVVSVLIVDPPLCNFPHVDMPLLPCCSINLFNVCVMGVWGKVYTVFLTTTYAHLFPFPRRPDRRQKAPNEKPDPNTRA